MSDDAKTMNQEGNSGAEHAAVNPSGHDDPSQDEVTQKFPAYRPGLSRWFESQ